MILKFKHPNKLWYYEIDHENIREIAYYIAYGTVIHCKESILDPESFRETSFVIKESLEQATKMWEECKFNDNFEELLK